MRKVVSDNGHLYYIKDEEGYIVKVSLFEEQIDIWLMLKTEGAKK